MEQARQPLVEPPSPVVAVDFDLTLVDDNLKLLPGAKEAMTHLKSAGWTVIVWTTRTPQDMEEARRILTEGGVPFDYINENPDTDINDFPRKIYFDATVDDKAVPFQGDWPRILSELERRRKAWQIEGLTKSKVVLRQASAEGVETAGCFYLKDGQVVAEGPSPIIGVIMKTGVETKEGTTVKPNDGVEFLKALSEIRGTYLWSEVF